MTDRKGVKNTTKKQHYVPKFYLKLFADSKKVVQVLDVKNNRLGSPTPISGVGYEPYFYAAQTGTPDEISQQVEDWLQKHEDIFSKEVPPIIDRITNLEHINGEDKYILSGLMSMLWLRSPKMRESINKSSEDLLKQIMSFSVPNRVDNFIKATGTKMSSEQREKMIKTFENGEYDLKFNNAQHLKMLTETLGFQDKGFTNMFYGQKWTIFIAKGNQKFITTDSPIVEWWLPPKSLYDGGFLERDKYFALTPDLLIKLTDPQGSSKMKRKTLFEKDDDTVRLLNILLAAHSKRFAYSAEKAQLQEIVNGRKKPGNIEIKYHKEYEKPWSDYKSKIKGTVKS